VEGYTEKNMKVYNLLVCESGVAYDIMNMIRNDVDGQ